MWWTVSGLVFDVAGAFLLVMGELRGNAALLSYWGHGEQSDTIHNRWNQYYWWKRWPIKIGSRFGSRRNMGQEAIEDSFPFLAWGVFLLIIGFVLQGVGSVLSYLN
jgi:hypothetical protein